MKWRASLVATMDARRYHLDPLTWPSEVLFVRGTPEPDLWLRPKLSLSVDKKSAGAGVTLSLTYRERAPGLAVYKVVLPPRHQAWWARFSSAGIRRQYLQWFCDAVVQEGETLYENERVHLLQKTEAVRNAVTMYVERLPAASSLFELEGTLQAGMTDADRLGAERLGFAVGSATGAHFAAALCFLRFETDVEGGILFERDFSVARDKASWRLPPGPHRFTGHPGVQRIQLLSDRVFLWGRERGFPEFRE